MYIGMFFVASSIVLFVLSFLQFHEKGFLLNRAYIWASKGKRKEMDAHKESKRPYYHQSGYVFLLLGISFVTFSLYCFLKIQWFLVFFLILMTATIIYAVASTIKIGSHK